MDASAGAGAGSGVASPVHNARKEWGAVSEHHSAHDALDGVTERDLLKVGQFDKRTVFEQGRDAEFNSITIESGMQNDILQQRLAHVSRQREELQQMEVELRARVIARSEIMEIQNRFETQMKEHVNNVALLQEQINDRDQTIQELERQMEDKDREIHAIKLDNEAWAKESLLRDKELASFCGERDNSEVERAQCFKQILDLQEHIKEKERQFLELQEQQRAAQESILFKDEQLREAQSWMTRAHELDTLHSKTIHSLQAELRDRMEQYNQLWVGFQRQFVEMERVHFNVIQQLQLELAEARGKNGTHKEEIQSAASHSSTKDAPQFCHDNEQHDDSGSVASNRKSAMISNCNEDNPSKSSTVSNASQVERNPGVPFITSPLGLSPYLSPAQMFVHPFMVQHQGVMNPAASHVPQNHVGEFQHPASQGPQIASQYQYQPSHPDQILMVSVSHSQPELPVGDLPHSSEYADTHLSKGIQNGVVVTSTDEQSKVQRSMGNDFSVEPQSQRNLQDISSKIQDSLNLNLCEDGKIQDGIVSESSGRERELSSLPNANIGINVLVPDTPVLPVSNKEIATESNIGGSAPHAIIYTTQTNLSAVGKIDSLLLDEGLLLACIARTMPASGKIRISSTLPNRLAKMLAPLHWHDYKKMYGKLDDFVAGHSELFVIDGDFIYLREGAQKKIAATAAAVKVAAAAASPSLHSVLPSVAVTPMAQSYRLKKSSSSEIHHNHHILGNQAQHLNGIHLNASGGQSENRFIRPNVSTFVTSGANITGSANARVPANLVGRQHGSAPGTTSNSQR